MPLPPDEVHVWFHEADIAPAALDDLSRTLTSAELVRARRYRFDEDRRRSIVARASLRLHLSRYSGEPASAILIAGEAGKKPQAPRTGIQFNVSHAGDLVSLAFSAAAPVGVDIERVRPVRDAAGIASRFFSPDEQREMAEAGETERTVLSDLDGQGSRRQGHRPGVGVGPGRVHGASQRGPADAGRNDPGSVLRLVRGGDRAAASRLSGCTGDSPAIGGHSRRQRIASPDVSRPQSPAGRDPHDPTPPRRGEPFRRASVLWLC